MDVVSPWEVVFLAFPAWMDGVGEEHDSAVVDGVDPE